MEDKFVKANNFINFVNSSPSPWHTVSSTIKQLTTAGFTELKLSENWELKKLGRYFLTKNKSTLLVFVIGGKYNCGNGFSIVAAHTDSPCLRLKPLSKKSKINYNQIGVQLYGGGIWYTWFDRDLTLAGRVIYKENENLVHVLYHSTAPLLKIPTLAIHLNHEYNEKWIINKETHLTPIISLIPSHGFVNYDGPKAHENEKIKSCLKEELKKTFSDGHNEDLIKKISETFKIKPDDIIDMELCLADTQLACIGGIKNDFIFSPRLDNLLGSFTALQGFLESLENTSDLEVDSNIRVIALYDNEEVGSESAQGAASAFTIQVFKRLSNYPEFLITSDKQNREGLYEKAIARSFLVSSDQAHAVHPNYAEKHEENHQIKIDGGFVIKHNANQRYATTAITSAVIKDIAFRRHIPLQEFVIRNDSTCGSTIGPIQSALLGIPTVDVGGPQLSMHSIRESCAVVSVQQGISLFKAFYEEFSNMDLTKLI